MYFHGYEIRAQAEIMKSFLIHYKRYMLGFMIMITLHQIKDVET